MSIKVTILTLGLILVSLAFPGGAKAAYNGARIIDDAPFLDARSMSIGAIQNHLSSKGSGLAGMSFKLDCYGESSKERQWYTAAGAPCDQTVPASQIIYYAAQIYGISPKVILATLQKEQSLVTSPNPTSWQINQAMGYGCPTTGGCGASTFFYQIDSGTWVLRYHYERARGNMDWWKTSTSWTCGSAKEFYSPSLHPNQNVSFYDEDGVMYRTYFLVNAATSSLYCYTPHAYNNPQGLYGRAPFGTVGRYYSGSYNFVTYYELWFGSTGTQFDPLQQSRWMELNSSVRKVSAVDSNEVEDTLSPGRHLRIMSKIYLGGEWCYRTEHDTKNNIPYCIYSDNFSELNIVYTNEAVRLEIKPDYIKKTFLRTGDPGIGWIPKGRQIEFAKKTVIGGKTYFITTHDAQYGHELGIEASQLIPASIFEAIEPTRIEILADTAKIAINDMQPVGPIITRGTVLISTSRINKNGVWHYRTAHDTDSLLAYTIPVAASQELKFTSFKEPRWMELTADASKVSPFDQSIASSTFRKGTVIHFDAKMSVNGVWYYRTSHDTSKDYKTAFLASNVGELSFSNMVSPRSMKVTTDTYKVVPSTGEQVDGQLNAGQIINFSSKVVIDGATYLRTTHDTTYSISKAIPISALSEL